MDALESCSRSLITRRPCRMLAISTSLASPRDSRRKLFHVTEDLLVAYEVFQGCTMITADQLRTFCVLGCEEATSCYASCAAVNLKILPPHDIRILTDSESCRQSTARQLSAKIQGIRTHM